MGLTYFRSINLLLTSLFTLSFAHSFGQVTLAFQGGEAGDTWAYTSTLASALAESQATQSPNKVTGTRSIVVGGNTGGGNCFGSGSGNGPSVQRTFTFNAIDITSSNESVRTLRFNWGNRHPACEGTGWDNGEDMYIRPYHNGVAQPEILIATGGGDTQYNIVTNQYEYQVPACVNNFSFVVYVTTNRADELLFLDNVRLTAPQLNTSAAQPSAITGDITVCPGSTGPYSVTAVGTTVYTWSGLPAGASFTTPNGSNSISVNWGTAAAGTYTLTVTPSGVCGGNGPSRSINVTIQSTPAPVTISGPSEVCAGQSITLTSSYASGNTWSNGQTTSSISVSAAGTYTVQVQTACGTVNDQHNVAIGDGPSINDVIITNVSCSGGNSGSIVVDATGTGLEYSLNGSGWQTSPSFTGLGAAVYQLSVRENGGCMSQTTATVEGSGDITVTVSNDGPYCEGEAIQLESVVNGAVSPVYSWSGPGGYVSSAANPANATEQGTYTLTVTDNGCSASASTDVVVSQAPSVTFDMNTACQGQATSFVSSAPQGVTGWHWDFGDGKTSSQPDEVSHTYAASGAYEVTLSIGVSGGCEASETNTVIVLESPEADFYTNPGIVSGSEPVAFINNSQGANSYEWIFPNGDELTEESPQYEFVPGAEGYGVWLYAHGANGCSDSIYKVIPGEAGLLYYVPNVFTPDGDEYNNTFQPVFTQGFDPQNFTLYVYNRWGQLLYESHDPTVGWDGTHLGNLASEGVYTWQVRFKHISNDKWEEQVGHLTLIR